MSSRNQTIVDNPCVKYIQWETVKNDDEKITGGQFKYWDKDTETNIPVSLPFKFALLTDDLVTFAGYDEKRKQGVWSNEVKEKNHGVTIRSKEGVLLEFKLKDYKANKPLIEATGAKYTKPIYMAVEGDNGYEIWCMKLKGSGLTGGVDQDNFTQEERNHGFFNFAKYNKAKKFSNFIEVDTYAVKKKGSSKFSVPVFAVGDEINAEQADIFNNLCTQYEDYLKYYFNKPVENTENEVVTTESKGDVFGE